MGADNIEDLDAEYAPQLATHLDLPPIKHKKLVAALAGGKASPAAASAAAAAPPEDKYQAQTLIMGHASEAAHGLNHALGLSHAELPDLLKKGEQAIIDEFNAHGSADNIANLHYILKGTACEEPLPDHVRQQIKTRKYHGGSLDDGEFDAGHKGKRFEDFVTHEYCCKANLVRPHVLALRLYTSSSYPCFNDHLRKNTKPHPFKMAVYYLNEAIKRLRSVAAKEFPA